MPVEIELREVIIDDLPTFFQHQAEPEANRMAAFPPRELETFTAHWAKIMADDSVTLKTILYNGRVAGNIVSFGPPEHREVGYWLGKEFWGRGIATRALAEFVKIVKVRPLFAYAAKHNFGSLRVLQKCGFIICGEDQIPSSNPSKQLEEFILKLDK
jgi:RimJ/RimL family protein N-acetyltransferase